MLWRWPWRQHLEVFVLSSGKRQRPEGKLGVEREIHAKIPRCHGLSGRMLSISTFLARLYRRLVIRYLEYDLRERKSARSISREHKA
jgi:hypothetical protein